MALWSRVHMGSGDKYSTLYSFSVKPLVKKDDKVVVYHEGTFKGHHKVVVKRKESTNQKVAWPFDHVITWNYVAIEKRYIHFFEAYCHQSWEGVTFNEGILSTKSHEPLSCEIIHKFICRHDTKITKLRAKLKRCSSTSTRLISIKHGKLMICSIMPPLKGNWSFYQVFFLVQMKTNISPLTQGLWPPN